MESRFPWPKQAICLFSLFYYDLNPLFSVLFTCVSLYVCLSVATDSKDEEIKVPKRLFLGMYSAIYKKRNPLKQKVVHLPI